MRIRSIMNHIVFYTTVDFNSIFFIKIHGTVYCKHNVNEDDTMRLFSRLFSRNFLLFILKREAAVLSQKLKVVLI